MKKLFSFLFALTLLASVIAPAQAAVIPTFEIVSVVDGESVTIQTKNFPANDSFNVTMGLFGTRGVNGTKVATWDSGQGGSQTITFNIPAALKTTNPIAIRLQSPTSGYFSYNWFYNKTSGGTGGPLPTSTAKPSVIPTFTIEAVVTDQSVTIKTANLPANDSFRVLMNKIGTRGVNGTLVETIDSGTGGSLEFTFDIPDSLKGLRQIAIRLESPTSGFFSYNWFYNNTTSNGGTGGPVITPGKTPTFTIASVVKDETVTISTKDFPANDTFTVSMGTMGTRGVNGTVVDTVSSGSGGVLSFTFNIPANMKGAYQIAIRLESAVSGYYSFNWFYNNTTN